MIPRIIHFIWIGPPIPKWVSDNMEAFRRLNPDFELRVHGEDVLLPQYAKAYSELTALDSRSDLLALSAVRRYGGWYFDSDFVPFRPISEIESGWQLDGSRMFISEQRGQKDKTLTMANAVIAATTDCPAWPAIDRYVAGCRAPHRRCTFGPELFTRLAQSQPALFRIGGWPWFYPAEIGRAMDVYHRLGFAAGEYLASVIPAGGQVPFMLHLWTGGSAVLPSPSSPVTLAHDPVPVPAGPLLGLRVGLACTEQQRADPSQIFQSVIEGLAALGCNLQVRVPGSLFSNDPQIVFLWNGRKGLWKKVADSCVAAGAAVIRMEHGFFDRRQCCQADHKDILHGASWVDQLRKPAPPEGAERLAAVWPRPLVPAKPRTRGYVLVIGQVPGDSQLFESVVQIPRTLVRLVAEALPAGHPLRFRPHPKARSRVTTTHITRLAPLSPGGDFADDLAGARFCVTVNSNAGNEALALGCPVLSFGPSLYNIAGVAHPASPATIKQDLHDMLHGWQPDAAAVENYLRHLACRQYSQADMRQGDCLIRLLDASGVLADRHSVPATAVPPADVPICENLCSSVSNSSPVAEAAGV